MQLIVKHFSELSTAELFAIYKLRVSVFVVEQQCPYQEVDDADQAAYHIWLQDETGIKAYARVLPKGETFPTVSIGRVIAVKRRCGLGSKIVQAAIRTAKEKLGADRITIEAQVYARTLYEKAGFRPTSEEFLEDGIPHIQMQLDLQEQSRLHDEEMKMESIKVTRKRNDYRSVIDLMRTAFPPE